jgi:hypothetical protein
MMVAHLTREARLDVPPGCLFVKMRGSECRLGPGTRAHVDKLRACGIAAYSTWLERAQAA